MYQHLYSRFLKANPGKQHFACHSHYYWPDITREAQLKYWDDSARYADQKWDYFFTDCVPDLQKRIAKILNAPDPQQCVFGPNTHELLYRILTCLDLGKPVNILTTDSEFHSFSRQAARLDELANITVKRVPSFPFETFQQRFIDEIKTNHYDMVFFSQVFFNSGVAVDDVDAIVHSVEDPNTIVVVDGYHGFMAIPTDISQISDRAFYLSGSYKYAQGGEGACFAFVPNGCELRPVYTGWFAEFGELSAANQGEVTYSKNGMRFAGATMDFSALYRLRAVLQMFQQNSLSVASINQYIKSCQMAFMETLSKLQHPLLNEDHLLLNDFNRHGHFLTYELPSQDVTESLSCYLREQGIMTDYRANRLRFGFALYHNPESYDLSCLATATNFITEDEC